MLADLHAHTTASDGTDTPAQLMAAARAAGVDVVALTDHDSTAGWAAAGPAAEAAGVALVRGIEVSCQHGGVSVHLLGYLLDPSHPELSAELERSRTSRVTRAERIVAMLGRDLPIRFEHVLEVAPDGATIGRPHIADAMVGLGLVASRDEAFARYLFTGSRYYASHYAPAAVRAVRLVREAGGVPVMAHPFAGQRGWLVDDAGVAELAAAGLFGLEVHHPDHDASAVRRGLRLADALGLAVTGSSDYHGTGKVNRLGQCWTVPDVLEGLLRQASGVPLLGG